jgi:energy-converting hydrogenase Eha subunit B
MQINLCANVESMNSLVYILVGIIVWMAYTMFKTYQGMQHELREIRMKCVGSDVRDRKEDPADTMRSNVLSLLSTFANMSKP